MSLSGSCTFKEVKQNEEIENGEVIYNSDITESSSTKSLTFTKTRKTLQRVLFLLVVLLVIICIVLVILYALEVRKSGKQEKTSDKTCYTSNCMKVSSVLLQDMNTSFSPCTDFMKYSCNGWVQRNPIGAGEDEQASMLVLADLNDKKLRYHVEALGNYESSHPMSKVKNLYFSCINQDSIEENSYQDFEGVLASYGPWPVLNDTWKSGSWNWVDELARFQSLLMEMAPLVNLEVLVNPKDTNEYTFRATPPEILLHDFFASNDTKVLSAVLDYRVRVIVLLGGNESVARQQMQDVIDFEIALAKIIPSFGEIYSHWYDTHYIRDLESKTGFPWLRYLNKVLEGTKITLNENKRIVVPSMKYFKDLKDLIVKTDNKTLLNQFMWTAVSGAVEYLTSPFQKAYKEFKLRAEGTAGTTPRWLRCIRELSMRSGLTMVMGKIWVDHEFDKNIVPMLKEMLEHIKEAFRDEVAKLKWLDEKSKKKVFEKVDTMKDKMGYPELCNNLTQLTEYYKELEINTVDRYLLNSVNVSRWYCRQSLLKLGQPVDHTEWFTGPHIVNAFYKMSQNEILINAGILQPPFFYGTHAPRAVNYGAIGTVLGHELTHGFDSLGSRFNKHGEIGEPWMTNHSLNEFRKRSQCLIDQYDNYRSDLGNGQSIKIDGTQTLAENIADNAGLRLAYLGYKNWVAANSEEEQLPGLGLTNEQVLFLSFGQLYCYKATPSGIRKRIQTDTHAMPEFRTIGCVSNLKSFSELFGCSDEDKMNPARKCRIW